MLTLCGRTSPAQTADATKVTIGVDGFLRVDGKPHFPIGLYSATRFDELGKAGFTATHSYGIVTGDADAETNPNDARLKELLNRTWTKGMRMMVELPRKAIE